MKLKQIQFVQLLQGILSKLIDETELKALEVKEEEIPDDDVDLHTFDFLTTILVSMKMRYCQYKDSLEDDPLQFKQRLLEHTELVEEEYPDEDDSDDNNGNGVLQ